MPSTVYTARVVAPMSGPPFADGGVLVDGDRIVAVGAATDLETRADRRHDVDGVLLPGFVDGHTCVEHADADRLAVPGPHAAWVQAVDGLTGGWSPDRWSRSARRGVQALLRAGTTTAADAVVEGPGVPALSRAQIRGTSYVELDGVDDSEAAAVLGALERSLGLPAEGRRVGIGVAATTAVSEEVMGALAQLSARTGAPLQIRAARTSAELAAIRGAEGPLVERAAALGLDFDWAREATGRTPVRHLDACGALGAQTVLVHGTWVDALEARRLADTGITVVLTPRSDRLLQAGEAPVERYADSGVPLALGTASPAGTPDPDLLAEAGAFCDLARERGLALWPGMAASLEEQAVRLITADGARALGHGDEAGVIEPGRRADLVGVQLDTTPKAVYRDLVERGAGRQVLTVLAGVRRSRRASAEEPWPLIDRQEERG